MWKSRKRGLLGTVDRSLCTSLSPEPLSEFAFPSAGTLVGSVPRWSLDQHLALLPGFLPTHSALRQVTRS